MIKAIVFDFDYTLTDRSLAIWHGFSELIEPYLKDADWMEKEAVIQRMITLDEFGTISRDHIIDFLVKELGLDENRLKHDFSELSMKMAPYTQLDKNAMIVLEYFYHNPKYKTAILTNGNIRSQRAKIHAVKIADYFDEIVVSEESGYSKPDPRAFLYVADKLGIKCEECLYVGDVFFNDIIGAYRAKMQYVLLNNDRKRCYDQRIPQIEHLIDLIRYVKEIENE